MIDELYNFVHIQNMVTKTSAISGVGAGGGAVLQFPPNPQFLRNLSERLRRPKFFGPKMQYLRLKNAQFGKIYGRN